MPDVLAFIENPVTITAVIAVLLFLDSLSFIGIFIPGVPIAVAAGILVARKMVPFWPLVISACIASIVGKTVSYELGRRKEAKLLNQPGLKEEIETGKMLAAQGSTASFFAHFAGAHRHAMPFAEGRGNVDPVSFQTRSIPSAILRTIWPILVGMAVGSLWHVAVLWSTRARLLFLLVVSAFAFIGWVWGWTLRRGGGMLRFLGYLGSALLTAAIDYPPVRSWRERHPRIAGLIADRVTLTRFSGLPLTLLILTISKLLWWLIRIAQSVLMEGAMAAGDVRLNHLLLAFRDRDVVNVLLFITDFASTSVVIAAGCLLVVLLWLQRQRLFAFGAVCVLLVNQCIVTALKNVFHRPRPVGAVLEAMESTFSFPSGHAAASVALYGFLSYLLLSSRRSWKFKISALFCAVCIILLIDLSRLYLGVHYLSDVLAGNIIGCIALLITITIVESMRRRYAQNTERAKITATVGAVFALELLIVMGFSFSTASVLPAVSEPPTRVIAQADILPLFKKGTLPSYTETLFASQQEPINLIIQGSESCLISSLKSAHWFLADSLSARSLKQAAIAAFVNGEYPKAPMTPTFYFSHPHDLGFEKETDRRSIRSRHHFRVWQTDYTTAAGALWVGTVSFDTGLKWGGVMHTIDPAIDLERTLVEKDLRMAGALRSSALVPLTPPILGKNFTGDSFFTDGQAVMLKLKCE